jgi:hypothetical protein
VLLFALIASITIRWCFRVNVFISIAVEITLYLINYLSYSACRYLCPHIVFAVIP